MERKLELPVQITPSMCDASARLGIPNTFGLFMDIATIHAESLGLGAEAMLSRGLFWLTVKTKIRFHRRPALMESAAAATWPGLPGRMRCMRYYTLTGEDQALLAEGKTEWAVMEMKTGALHSVEEIYPKELELTEETVCETPFARLNKDFSDCPELYRFSVRSTDIDLGGHMNNAAYVHRLMEAFSVRQQKELAIGEIEVSFRAPCYEGDVLSLRKRETPEGMELGLVRPEGKTALLVKLTAGV
jgi:medium-chain acyl-[acyl-carrier-protein] hydrolase